ncbi:MAG: RagB/SusD family nutrient uptake outer membrane protein [Mariniphaga sp.]|nr:RagB/SusD family nutrient uptake outer membrane protein [Mariniphaga sp.]MDD4226804.1 RagB/SusD family nutrient uptake outer membrane protein [Mariniphaga sp.]
MKRAYSILILQIAVLSGVFLFTSCEDYLDKSPEVTLSEEDVFTKFESFQGYLEDIYQQIPQIDMGTSGGGDINWNWGDDVLMGSSRFLVTQFDAGNLWGWQSQSISPFRGNAAIVAGNNTLQGQRGWWENGWLGIRKSNIVLNHLGDLATSSAGTVSEQRDLLEGQARFLRAFFHFEILRAWGGIAYVDTVFAPSDEIRLPRLSYYETAMKVAEDLEKAAQLLPIDWENTPTGQLSPGRNKGRASKPAALGYLGKNLLYAASPLMNGVSTGSYTYNEELCKKAADAFLQVINISNSHPDVVGLETWENYYKSFYTLNYSTEIPNGKEIIWGVPLYFNSKRWRYGEHTMTYLGAWGVYAGPTQNYVELFGMANGLAIDEPDSGFEPAAGARWKNRDPRFYYNILYDSARLVLTEGIEDTWAQLYTGGRHRGTSNSISGYGHLKFKHISCNNKDNGWGRYSYEVPLMRLADIYLMYAEAVNEAYGPTGNAPGGMTAVEAVNVVRNRATLPNVDPRYYTSKEKFREFLYDERAVELAFESHRWYDIRRWYVAHLPKYKEKYIMDTDKEHTFFRRVLYTTRVHEEKHYWLPFPTDQVSLYPEFQQNPGW